MTDLLDRLRYWMWRQRIAQASARLDRINREMVALRKEQHAAANLLHSLMREFKAGK